MHRRAFRNRHVHICVRARARACVFQMRRPGDSKMLCSDSNCRSRKHHRKAAAAAVDSELVSVPSSPAARAEPHDDAGPDVDVPLPRPSVPSSPAARAEPHGDAGPDVDVPLPRPSRRKRKWEQRQLATCAAAPADLKPVSALSQPAAPRHTCVYERFRLVRFSRVEAL